MMLWIGVANAKARRFQMARNVMICMQNVVYRRCDLRHIRARLRPMVVP